MVIPDGPLYRKKTNNRRIKAVMVEQVISGKYIRLVSNRSFVPAFLVSLHPLARTVSGAASHEVVLFNFRHYHSKGLGESKIENSIFSSP